ncbi:fibrinogen-like YCDxxxxGGGW domain-containing protein [Aeromicrobium sp. 50.2.37]|uniref:fibrinogen-like YCDxxxxGGGW domain-containing protein n=1 Tax=Aeromicrobium sp. 50.2.37 TaxID=2969305 RepID=UPI0021502FB8|nr:fibrinogen-like YCDxxxxGGGW domain-containing protein [Aeromicrobium sp. 50.2.37]MCR4514085.1 fibrinogen-like YCDxxxxGGGW domain-containing protein [Aeromicrobium sp. 50.2.37]
MRRTPRVGLLAAASLVVALVVAPPAAQAAPTTPDGASPEAAAASCWEVKQAEPSATDGVYWLLTPQLRTPTQFYCDMTTDGGGWVLVGRGRDGWSWDGDAQGTPAQIASTPTGQSAFAPKKLSTATVDALLGGRRVDALEDGIRLRRAASQDGTAWQEVRMRVRSLASWSWAFGAGHPLTSASFDGTSFSGATSRDFGTTSTTSANRLRRVWTFESSTNGWVRGFNYGSAVTGSTSASSNLYATGNGNATPFTQVFIRPKLRQSDVSFPTVPDAGTDAITALPVARSGSLAQPWGVTGTGSGGTGELGTEVQAFAQVGNTMYVGGNFTTVRNQSGSQSVAQPYLAAFDATTGEWIPSFRPRLNRQVRALVRLPGDRLAVGGDFTTVNGSTRRGLAVFTASGALDPSWTTGVVQTTGDRKPTVRALDVAGGRLYVGGRFTHVRKGSRSTALPFVARVSSSTGVVDTRWAPKLNGTVADLDVAADGKRLYLAGYMTKAAGRAVRKGLALSTAARAPIASPAWKPRYSTTGTATYQQAVRQVGSRVWLGGSQHSMFAYDASTLALKVAHITRSGGDLQAIGDNGRVVYGGCHCGDWSYTGATSYDSLKVGSTSVAWKQAGKISLLGAWDNATGAFVTTFAPQWKSRGGFGVWAVTVAKDGTLWAGGSIQTSVKDGGGNQFSGGFARFAQRPASAPSAPSGAKAVVEGSSATVSWGASASSGVSYEVLRNDRVVATTSSTTVSVPGSTSADRFFVRASDGQGNWSASTSVVRAAVS